MNVPFHLGMLFKSLQIKLVFCRSHWLIIQLHKETWTEAKSSHKISPISKIIPNFLIVFVVAQDYLHIFSLIWHQCIKDEM